MVLENFDPVGRWRDHYPLYVKPPDGEETLKKEFYSDVGKGTKRGPRVDAVGILPDGTRLENIRDLKRYFVDHIEVFNRCLVKKLLVYATGRPLSFGDRLVAEDIATDITREQLGFRDLIVKLVCSGSFGTN